VDLELLIFRLARPGQVLCGDTIKKYRDVQQSGWAAIVIDDLTSINPWQPRMLEIRGRAEAIPTGGAGLGPEFSGAFIRVHPEKVNSFGLA
jgi:pyridoxamine 5'-phosphate oxidase family protein